MIKVGDLVKMKVTSHYPGATRDRNVTGVVVDVVLGDTPGSRKAEEHWLKIVFLDGTKSTLFHDEIEVVTEIKGDK